MASALTRKASPVVAALLIALSFPAASLAESATGKIKGYECGDNCYLTIAPASGEEITGMCAAPECEPWNEVAEIPSDMIGVNVTVMIEMGQQLDGAGNLMGEFPAFTEIVFDN